jgi:hypothetical protein
VTPRVAPTEEPFSEHQNLISRAAPRRVAPTEESFSEHHDLILCERRR